MRTNLIYILVIGFLISITNTTNAQEKITLEQCRSLAIEYNKQLKKAKYQQGEAQAYKKAAKTAYLPSLSAEVTAMHLPESIDISMPGGFLPTATSLEAAQNGDFSGTSDVYSSGMEFHLDNVTYVNGAVSLSQPIYTGGKIHFSNKKADAGVSMSEFGYNLKFSEVIELTDKAFWQVAMIDANIDIAESYIEMVTELEEQMVKMYELGLSPASEKLKVSVQKNEANFQLLKARNGLKISKMYLNQILGRALSTEVEINYGKLSTTMYDLSNGVESALLNRNELKLIEKQLEIAEYDKKITRADYLPTVGVSAQYSTIYVDDIYEDLDLRPMFAGQVSIPLFAWGQGKHKQDAADFVIKQQQEELDRTNDLISLEVMQVQVQVEEAFEQISIAKANIAEAAESLDETKASFDLGLNTTTELLNAQTAWLKTQAELINASAQFKLLETSWRKATGRINPDEY